MVGGGGSAPKLAFTSLGLTPQTPKLATLTVTIMHARSQGVVAAQSVVCRTLVLVLVRAVTLDEALSSNLNPVPTKRIQR